ncbi:putative SbcC [Aeromonas phage CF8]|nr:putative SbcC [Aeromonas phage CF8]
MIVGLTLKNYNPLLKKGVSIVELDTRELFNIILGRNGFGKTSLLREISPFPPDNADYAQGGYKEWRYKDDRGTFVLKSSTGKSSNHEFIFNGKNLNEGNTLLVQRELVKIHFGLTPNIKNVLTGLDVRDLFTTMSAARRKDFLMSVNPNDTSYALKIFDKLKNNYNAIKGGLKTQRQRLVVEEGRMTQLASMNVDELQKEINLMDEQLKNALLIHGSLANVDREDILPLKEKINDIISRLLASNPEIKFTKGQYIQQREQKLVWLDRCTKMNAKLSTILGEITTQLQGVDNGTDNLEGYELRLKQVLDLLDLYTQELEETSLFFDNHREFKAFNNVNLMTKHGHELIDQIQMVSRARDPDVSSTSFVKAQEQLTHLRNEHNTIENDIKAINHQLAHFNNAEAIACPACDNEFKLGFERFDKAGLEERREVCVKRSVTLCENIKTLESYIEVNEDWYHSMSGLMRFIKRQHESLELLDLVQVYQIGKKDTGMLVECIRRSLRWFELEKQTHQLSDESQQLQAQIKFLRSSDIAGLFQRAEDTERELAITQRQIQHARDEIAKIDEHINLIIEHEALRDQLDMLIEEIKEKVENNGKFLIKTRVEEVINEISPRKDQLISGLIRAQSLHSVIDSIKENIIDLERREKHTLLLMEGLSPVKGLIGYLMNDFLKAVVGNVNAIIHPIWSNRLHVLNCETSKTDDDSVDLNYQFPVISGDSDKTNKDIGDCSGGEREIINFAFRVVLLRYLGKHCGLPLIMDEVGVAFDELHRGRFSSWLSEQLRMDKLGQIFMVSHYIAQFGAYHDANVIALNTEGLSVGLTTNTRSVFR